MFDQAKKLFSSLCVAFSIAIVFCAFGMALLWAIAKGLLLTMLPIMLLAGLWFYVHKKLYKDKG